MKLALLSDIHGNPYALESVLKEVRSEGIQTLLIAGDFVGYYYGVAAALHLLEDFEVIACKGNHETLLDDWTNGNQETRKNLLNKYGHGFEKALSELTPRQIEWLSNLGHPLSSILNERRVILSHGSPWDLNLYLYESNIQQYHKEFNSFQEYDLAIIGHSHYQFITKMEKLLIVNPGSVGQPRSGEFIEDNEGLTRAQWATYCCKSGHIELKTTFYPSSQLIEEIDRYDNNLPYLKKVLLRR